MASRLVECYQGGGSATVAFLEEPQNIEEALTCENSKEWECAMQEEYDFLMTNNTWILA